MKKTLCALAVASMMVPAYAQEIGVEGLYSYDTDGTRNYVTTIRGWAKAPSTVDDHVMSWFTTGDVNLTESVDGTIRVQVTSDEPAAFATTLTGVNATQASIRLRVRVSDWNKLTKFTVLLASDEYTAEHSLTLDVKRKMINPPSGEWVEIVAPISQFEPWGEPDTKNVKFFMVSVAGEKGVTVDMGKASIVHHTTPARVTFTFDDGRDESMVGMIYLRQEAYTGTLFVDPSKLGQPGYLDERKLAAFKASEWDIAGHHIGNLTRLSPEDASARVEMIGSWLHEHGFNSEMFAWPNGAHSEQIDTGPFMYLFNIDTLSNPSSGYSTKRINRYSIDRWTTVEMVQKWIDDAVANNEWLVLNFHVFETGEDESWEFADFVKVVDYVKASGVAVMSASTALAQAESYTEETFFEPILDHANNTVRNQADATYAFNVGASGTEYRVTNGDSTSSAQELRLLGRFVTQKVDVDGYVGGLRSNEDVQTTTGGVTVTVAITDSLRGSLEWSRSLMDSVEGTRTLIMQRAYGAALDYNPGGWGLYGGAHKIHYSDGNSRELLQTKAYVDVYKPLGVNVYLKTKHHRDTEPYTGTYFAPDRYDRYAFGAGIRTNVAPSLVLVGYADAGQQVVDGDTSPAWAARVGVESKPSKHWSLKGYVGVDHSQPDYSYKYLMGHVVYLF